MNQEKTPTNSEKESEQRAASEKEPQISDEMNGKKRMKTIKEKLMHHKYSS